MLEICEVSIHMMTYGKIYGFGRNIRPPERNCCIAHSAKPIAFLPFTLCSMLFPLCRIII